jgi:cyclopropane fatty-acyl-phospholipid synthase-like methyltransferase
MSEGTPGRIGREYYDGSDYFDAQDHLVDPNSAFHQYRLREVMRLAAPQPQDKALDIGCGWGTITFGIAPHVAQVLGVDFSQRSVDFCEARKTDGRGGEAPNRATFLCADGGDTGLEAEGYDLAVAADLFEHLYPEDTARVCSEAHRLLAPGGRFAVWTPHRGHVLEVLKNRDILLKHDPSHVDYKSMDRVKAYLTDAGFLIDQAYYAPSHLPGLRTLERTLQGVVPLFRRRIAVLGRKPDFT